MTVATRCPECGAAWTDGKACEDSFHQMSAWEFENPEVNYKVHHLMVLCDHSQHPSLYSSEGLSHARRLLVDFLERDVTTDEVRRRGRAALDSGTRKFRIKGTPTSHGAYRHPISWPMTATDQTAGGPDRYAVSVKSWARSVLDTLRNTGDLSSD